jgi:hypothetical protein
VVYLSRSSVATDHSLHVPNPRFGAAIGENMAEADGKTTMA